MTTTYTNGITSTQLSAIEASTWLSHPWRESVIKTIAMIERDASEEITSISVIIEPTFSRVTCITLDGKTLATASFRHWQDGYCGVQVDSIYGSGSWAICQGSLINLQ